jgi:hypothetical protein
MIREFRVVNGAVMNVQRRKKRLRIPQAISRIPIVRHRRKPIR